MNDPLTEAALEAAHDGAPPLTFRVGPDAEIRLADRRDGSPLLAGATITAWADR
jgi:hypothetical protein